MNVDKKYINVIPLLVLVLICLYTSYAIVFEPINIDGTLYERQFNFHLYAGFGILLLALGLYLIKSRYFKHVVLILLLLWLVGATNYLPVAWQLGFGFGAVSISVQIVALLFIAVYYFLNRKRADSLLLNLVAVRPDAERVARMHREEIDKFKMNFRNFSIEKLQVIVTEKKLVGSAVVAAQELLAEKAGTSS